MAARVSINIYILYSCRGFRTIIYVRFYLHSGLGESDPHGDLLAHEYVRIVGLAETPFQLVELRRREPGPVSLLLVRLAGFVAVGPAGGGQPVAAAAGRRRGQVETAAARQPERSAAAGRDRGGGQLLLRRRETVALHGVVAAAESESVACSSSGVVSAAATDTARLQVVQRSVFECVEVFVALCEKKKK